MKYKKILFFFFLRGLWSRNRSAQNLVQVGIIAVSSGQLPGSPDSWLISKCNFLKHGTMILILQTISGVFSVPPDYCRFLVWFTLRS
jgi:hypothetical protein